MDTIFNTNGCFYRALDDEPVFVLLARDPCFAEAVRWWVTLRQALIGRGEKPLEDHSVLAEALTTAASGVVWRAEATDPSTYEGGEPRWRGETAPLRELVESDRLARLETRLIQNANRFLGYAKNHFDKGTSESDTKGEVNWTEYLEICDVLGITPAPKPTRTRSRVRADAPIGGNPVDWDHLTTKGVFIWEIRNHFRIWSEGDGRWLFAEKKGDGWTGAYYLQKSLQRDMLIGAYRDYMEGSQHKVSTIKRLLHKGSAAEQQRRVGMVPELGMPYGSDEPVPPSVYYGIEGGNFYSAETNQGMGFEFHTRWKHREADFPQKVHDEVSIPANYPHAWPLEAEPVRSIQTVDKADPESPSGFRTEPVRVFVDEATPEQVLESFRKRFPDAFDAWMEREEPWTKPLPPSVEEMMNAPTEGEDDPVLLGMWKGKNIYVAPDMPEREREILSVRILGDSWVNQKPEEEDDDEMLDRGRGHRP